MNDHVDDYTLNTMERYQEKGMVKGTDDVKGYGVEKGTLSALWSKKTVEKRIVIDVTEEDERKGRMDRDHADDVEVDGSGEKVDGAHPHGGGAEEKDTGEGQRPQEDGFQIRMCSGFAVMDVDGVNDGDGQVKDLEPQKEEHLPQEVHAEQQIGLFGKDIDTSLSQKKRKRSTFTDSVVYALEGLFASTAYPSTTVKEAFAAEHGVEVKKVNNWMERRRKQARANGVKLEKPSLTPASLSTGKNELKEDGKGIVKDAAVHQMESMGQELSNKEEGIALADSILRSKAETSIGDLQKEAKELRERGLLPPLLDLKSVSDLEYSDETLCSLVAGQRMKLTDLVNAIHGVLREDAPSKEAIRTSIVDLAFRKSFDPANAGVKKHQTLEWDNADVIGQGLWQWDVREKETVPANLRQKTSNIRKRSAKVGERLKAIEALLDLSIYNKKEALLDKAITHFNRTLSMKELDSEALMKQKVQETKERQKAEREAEKLRREEIKRQLREEKEQERKAKELEKARKLEEKEKQKTKLKEEKEAEKMKKVEKKICKRIGFKDPDTLHKTANKFMNFFKSPVCPKEDVVEEKNLTSFDRRFPKPPKNHTAALPQMHPCCLDDFLSSQMRFEDVMEEWRNSLARARENEINKRKVHTGKYLGLPPSWARKSDAFTVAEDRMNELKCSGMDAREVRTWRRKFIWFPADSARPPYYGSWSIGSKQVNPRRPLGQDPVMDYEVMSDLDWEEEPEGSSLSRGDSMSEATNETVEEDSFFVADGYLSADEGVNGDEDDDGADFDSVLVPESNEPMDLTASNPRKGEARSSLVALLDKSKRTGKPVILVREGVHAEANHGAYFQGDIDLIKALEMEMLLPGLFEIPENPWELHDTKGQMPASVTKIQSPAEAAGLGDHAAAVKGGDCAELLPVLSQYILENSSVTKPLLVEGFVGKFADRKLKKKWVNESISLLAIRKGSKWMLKSKEEVSATSAAQPPDVEKKDEQRTPNVSKTPACTLRAPRTTDNKSVLSVFQRTPINNQSESNNYSTPKKFGVATGTDDILWQYVVEELESDSFDLGLKAFKSAFSYEMLTKHAQFVPSSVGSILAERICREMEKCKMDIGAQEPYLIPLMSGLANITDGLTALDDTNAVDDSIIARPRSASVAEIAQHDRLVDVLCTAASPSTKQEELRRESLRILSCFCSDKDTIACMLRSGSSGKVSDLFLELKKKTPMGISMYPYEKNFMKTWDSMTL